MAFRRPSARTVIIGLVGFGVLSQAIRPARTNPPIDSARTIQARTSLTPEVAAILDRSCRDCHSSATEWPWYSNVAPTSWVVISHVNDGRRHLSLSNWAEYDPKQAAKKLGEMCEQVRQGEMPLTSYTLIHQSAKLSEDDKQVICAWTEKERGMTGR